MTKTVGYRWQLRALMARNGMHATVALVPLLADRGVVMTATQVYRIVTGEPERLNMRLLSALCDIFGCTPNDLIEPYVVATSTRRRKTAVGDSTPASTPGSPSASRNRPRRATVTKPTDS
jgi:DNA-binding Xre family transcriptional regulator